MVFRSHRCPFVQHAINPVSSSSIKKHDRELLIPVVPPMETDYSAQSMLLAAWFNLWEPMTMIIPTSLLFSLLQSILQGFLVCIYRIKDYRGSTPFVTMKEATTTIAIRQWREAVSNMLCSTKNTYMNTFIEWSYVYLNILCFILTIVYAFDWCGWHLSTSCRCCVLRRDPWLPFYRPTFDDSRKMFR